MSTDVPSGRPDENPGPPEHHPAGKPADSQMPEPAQAETRDRQEYFEAISSADSQEVLSFGAMMATRPAAERVEWSPPAPGITNECGTLPNRGVFDKSPNRPASPARRLVIEATYPL